MDIEAILRKYEDRLMSLPNVVGVAIGERNKVAVIRVLVSRKLPADRLPAEHRVPRTLDGIATDVVEIGNLAAHGAAG